MTPWSIFKNIVSEDSRVIFWTCHPNNFVPDLHFLNFLGDGFKKFFLKVFLYPYYKKSKNFVKYLLKENSLFFMDQTTLKNTTYFLDVSIENPQFLPIAIEKQSEENSLRPLDKMSFVWIGRLVDFKFFRLFLYSLKANKGAVYKVVNRRGVTGIAVKIMKDCNESILVCPLLSAPILKSDIVNKPIKTAQNNLCFFGGTSWPLKTIAAA